MKMVKIAQAKTQLSRHLAYVKAGGRVRIVDRDHPVADLVPIEAAGDEDDVVASIERRGVGRRLSTAAMPAEIFRPGPSAKKGASVSDALLEERARGR